jgi:AraC family transcriptional regulator
MRKAHLGSGGSLDHGLQRARRHLLREFTDELSLDVLAQLACTTRFHFCRCYRRRYGVTPHRDLIDQRVRAAQRLLLDVALPVRDVGEAVGFRSRAAFFRSFKRATGLAPADWRASRFRATAPLRAGWSAHPHPHPEHSMDRRASAPIGTPAATR